MTFVLQVSTLPLHLHVMIHYYSLLLLALQSLYAAVLNTNKPVYINTPQVLVSSQLSNMYTRNANIAPYNNTYTGYAFGGAFNPYNQPFNNIYQPPYPPNPVPPPPPNYILSYQQALSYYNLTQAQLTILISNPTIPKPPPNIVPYTSQWVAHYAQYSFYLSINNGMNAYNIGANTNCSDNVLDQVQGDPNNPSGAINKAAFEKCMACGPPVL